MRMRILTVLLFAGLSMGIIGDTYGQSRRERIKNKFKEVFGTPRKPKKPSRADIKAPPPPPRPPAPRKPSRPPRPERPPAPPPPPPPAPQR